jgi:hypothetical protein
MIVHRPGLVALPVLQSAVQHLHPAAVMVVAVQWEHIGQSLGLLLTLEKDIRWPALFTEWDDENKTWRFEFSPNVETLSNAISRFKKHLSIARA